MQTVSPSAVEDAWNELYNTTEAHAGDLVDEFVREQPHLAEILGAAEEQINAIDDRGFLLLYGVWAWLAFRKAGRSRHAVSSVVAEATLARNQRDASWLEGAADKPLLDAATSFTRDYRQWPLFSAMISDIMQGELEREESADDITGILLIHAKSVIDALDA